MPSAVDQSWGRVNPKLARSAGVTVVCGYLSHDPSKNWTPAWVRAYHQVGIGVVLNWESDPGRPLLGAAAGVADGAAAVQLARALFAGVGYAPSSRIAIPFSCDRDVNRTQFPTIDAYYRATMAAVNAAHIGNGVYGEADLIEHLHAAGLTEVEWQTLAWSGGRISPQADLYQSSINNQLGTVSVDFDQVLHPSSAGVWWPPGSAAESAASAGTPTPIPAHPAPAPEDDMQTVFVRAATGRQSLWMVGPMGVHEIDPNPKHAEDTAAVVAAVLNIPNHVSYSVGEGALAAGGNFLNNLLHTTRTEKA